MPKRSIPNPRPKPQPKQIIIPQRLVMSGYSGPGQVLSLMAPSNLRVIHSKAYLESPDELNLELTIWLHGSARMVDDIPLKHGDNDLSINAHIPKDSRLIITSEDPLTAIWYSLILEMGYARDYPDEDA